MQRTKNAISFLRRYCSRYFTRDENIHLNNARFKRTQSSDSFYGSNTGGFTQQQPGLRNQYLNDPVLREYLKKTLPFDVLADIEGDLINFGERVSTDILHHHEEVRKYEPTLIQYDGWGKRIDQIQYHPSWKTLHDISAQEKLVSIPYENKYGRWSRLYQGVKLFLFHPSSGLYSCPLAMTDGAASILQSFKTEPFISAFKRLTSNEQDLFWTSGQWMTEKKGGSDVGNGTETYAVPQTDGTFRLYGYKWFTSAVDADIALTLARIVDQSGQVKQGTKGLTMFYLETRSSDQGSFNGLKIEKLKKKLGTRQMPTAEMILEGTKAYQLSDVGRGIASISPMLTVTRIHNGIFAVSTMRRVLNLSKDFATKRAAFGKSLINTPLHVQTLARMEVEQQAAFHLLMKICCLFGRVNNKEATDYEKLLLRILTPLLKLYSGKQAVHVISELLESFGGHGYLEDTGLPVYLRDAQVLSIWEGTTNVLSVDVLRSIFTSNGEVLKVLLQDCHSMSSSQSNIKELQKCSVILQTSLKELQCYVSNYVNNENNHLEQAARDFSYSLARLYIASLLYQNAAENPLNLNATQVCYRWICFQDLIPVVWMTANDCYSDSSMYHDVSLVSPKK